mmetsp:Transcript_81297/g.217357  ORF Transcript_81297/g.217357 Transcript_81297/m.217357 type:complete len:222 (-) Transcript_81297:165-830(-)
MKRAVAISMALYSGLVAPPNSTKYLSQSLKHMGQKSPQAHCFTISDTCTPLPASRTEKNDLVAWGALAGAGAAQRQLDTRGVRLQDVVARGVLDQKFKRLATHERLMHDPQGGTRVPIRDESLRPIEAEARQSKRSLNMQESLHPLHPATHTQLVDVHPPGLAGSGAAVALQARGALGDEKNVRPVGVLDHVLVVLLEPRDCLQQPTLLLDLDPGVASQLS